MAAPDPEAPASSAAPPGVRDDGHIDTAPELGDKVLHELVDAWISATNRLPKFLSMTETATPSGGGEDHWTTRALLGRRGFFGAGLGDVGPKISVPNVGVWLNRKVIHPFFVRRRMIREAKALGLDAKFARTLADLFQEIWRSGVTHELARKEQVVRIAELIRSRIAGG